ncbi:hypothetical protein D1007_18471 [Hordeum vulgare]|nr:hypothetical protein D1007_18471 [Hordeum vulgare]
MGDLLFSVAKNFPSIIAITPLLSFPKDTFYGGGLALSPAKSHLIDDTDTDKGIISVSSKGKDPTCDIMEGTLQTFSSKGKEPICNIREGTRHPCSSMGKEPIRGNREHTQNSWFPNGKEPIYDR